MITSQTLATQEIIDAVVEVLAELAADGAIGAAAALLDAQELEIGYAIGADVADMIEFCGLELDADEFVISFA